MFVSRCLSHPKEFGVSDYNEDFASCSDDGRWFAISDGVGSALFSDIWSRSLCQAICREKAVWGEPSFDAAMAAARQQWHSEIDWAALDYFRKKKFSRQGGSFATLLYGMVDESACESSGEKTVRLWSYGDCNMFHIRDAKPVCCWPWTRATDFGAAPASLCSVQDVSTDSSLWQSHVVKLLPQDALLLATDAFAEYLVKQIEREQSFPYEKVSRITSQEFAGWIEEMRSTNSIERDDTTFLLITPQKTPAGSAASPSSGIWLRQQLFSGWKHVGAGWGKPCGTGLLTQKLGRYF